MPAERVPRTTRHIACFTIYSYNPPLLLCTRIAMADISKINRPLTRDSVRTAHERIKPYIHLTPVLQCETISSFASTPQSPTALVGTEYEGQEPSRPKMNIFFKCENYQRIGAFKARGAFHALSRLTDGQLEKGVITHSVGGLSIRDRQSTRKS